MRGGRREGAGRPKGARNRVSRVAVQHALASGDLGPLNFLLRVMRDDKADIRLRIRAAKAAAPFFHPKPRRVK
jgi:hypothetical protein